MGGTWDATNVADATVAVITPIGVDHERYLGDTPADIAVEKAGIIKSGTFGDPRSAARRGGRGAAAARGRGRRHRRARGRRVRRHRASAWRRRPADHVPGTRRDVRRDLPARCTVRTRRTTRPARSPRSRPSPAARPRTVGSTSRWFVRRFAQVTLAGSPRGRAPLTHGRAGRRAQPARRAGQLRRRCRSPSRSRPLIGVVGVMADKDVEGCLDAFEPVMYRDRLHAELDAARDAGRVTRRDWLAGSSVGTGSTYARGSTMRSRLAIGMAEDADSDGFGLGSGGVLVTGSVITAGEARTLLGRGSLMRIPRRMMCASVLGFECIVLGLVDAGADHDRGHRRGASRS